MSRDVCTVCGGPIVRESPQQGWLHDNPTDWITNPHRAIPSEVTS